MGRQTTPAKSAKVLLTIEEAAAMLSLGRTFTYDLVMRNQIMSVKVGRKRRIPTYALQAFVAQCVANMEEGV